MVLEKQMTVVKIGKQEGEMILVGETVVIIDDGKGGAPEVKAEAKKAEAPAAKKVATSGVKATYDFKFALY